MNEEEEKKIEESKHIVDRTIIKGVSQCQNGQHSWRQLTENEIACTKCPTVRII
jgi:hypothetical protein